MPVSNDIGSRGEAIFYVLITQFCGRSLPFFRPYFLGDKFPALDYLVELVDSDSAVHYFFVQVKTTTQGYTRGTNGNRRLKVQVSQESIRRMALYPAPTYVVGIDEQNEVGYIVAISSRAVERFSSLPTNFPLNCRTLAQLWEEVRVFWEKQAIEFDESTFID